MRISMEDHVNDSHRVVLTMRDKLHVTAFAFIIVSLVGFSGWFLWAESTSSLMLFEKGKEALSRRVEPIAFFITLPLYLAITALVVLGG